MIFTGIRSKLEINPQIAQITQILENEVDGNHGVHYQGVHYQAAAAKSLLGKPLRKSFTRFGALSLYSRMTSWIVPLPLKRTIHAHHTKLRPFRAESLWLSVRSYFSQREALPHRRRGKASRAIY